MSLFGQDHSWSLSLTTEDEFIRGSRDDLQDNVVLLLELVLFERRISEREDLLIILLDCSSLVGDCQEKILLQRSRSLDHEIKVEVTRVLDQDRGLTGLIDVNVTKGDHVQFLVTQRIRVGWLLHRVMQCVSNSLDIQRDGSRLLLDITKDVVIVFSLNPRGEGDLDRHLVVSSDHSAHGRHLQ